MPRTSACANIQRELEGQIYSGADIDVGDTVPRMRASDLDALTFATEYVARNKPCIITGETQATAWRGLALALHTSLQTVKRAVHPPSRCRCHRRLACPAGVGRGRPMRAGRRHAGHGGCHAQRPRGRRDAGGHQTRWGTRQEGTFVGSGSRWPRSRSRADRTLLPTLFVAHHSGLPNAEAAGDSSGPQQSAEWFITPEERKMTLTEFFKLLRSSRRPQRGQGPDSDEEPEVPYIQVGTGQRPLPCSS